MSSFSHWSRCSLHFISSAQTVQQPQMEHIRPVWAMFTALFVLYLLKKKGSATLRKKKQCTVLLLLYFFFFLYSKEGILNPLPKALSSWCHYLRFLQFGWEPHIWHELWRVNVEHFFPTFSLRPWSRELNIFEHGNMKTVRLMILCT